MGKVIRTRRIVIGGLLTSFALLIPLVFRGWLQVFIPPFSATLGSHVPSMLAMFISPGVAVAVGLGATLGFLITLGPVIAARAFIHVFWAGFGAYLYRRGYSPWYVLLAALPIHAIGEALVVLPFGFDLAAATVTVGIGTALHHIVDAAITMFLYAALLKSGVRLEEGGV